MTMEQAPEAPFLPPGLDDKRIESAIDRANTRLIEVGNVLLKRLDESHSGWMSLSERERLAAYSLFPTEAQIMAAQELVTDSPDPETMQMIPGRYASLKPLVEQMVMAPSLYTFLIFLGAIRPDRAEQIARDAKRLGYKIEKGKL